MSRVKVADPALDHKDILSSASCSAEVARETDEEDVQRASSSA